MRVWRFVLCSALLLITYLAFAPTSSLAASSGTVQVTVQVIPPENEPTQANIHTLAAFGAILLSANQATFSGAQQFMRFNL